LTEEYDEAINYASASDGRSSPSRNWTAGPGTLQNIIHRIDKFTITKSMKHH